MYVSAPHAYQASGETLKDMTDMLGQQGRPPVTRVTYACDSCDSCDSCDMNMTARTAGLDRRARAAEPIPTPNDALAGDDGVVRVQAWLRWTPSASGGMPRMTARSITASR